LNTAGFFAEHDGWDHVLEDIHQLTTIAREAHPGLPVFIFGHSMGSTLARDYASRYGKSLSGLILSGAVGNPGPALNFGIWLARRQTKTAGPRSQSFRLDKLTFGRFNQAFKTASTKFDWLSRDDREVAGYIADPYCGSVFTAGFFLDFFTGIRQVFRRETIDATPPELPILFLSGQCDPVGNFGRGVHSSARGYRRAGIAEVTVKLYPDARHEMLHELNKTEAYGDIVAWLEEHMKSVEAAE
jgi:alpha-beta hydrolase superfamily lysophospholipase